MQTTSQSSLGMPTKSIDAIALLDEDHRRMEKLFRKFETLPDDADEESKRAVVDRACAALMVHIRIEEEIFYPAVQRMLSEKITEETVLEYSAAKELMESLERLKPSDPFYDATFVVLAEYIKHHVRSQERELFPRVRRATPDLNEMGARMKQRKEELDDEDGPIEHGPTSH